MKMYQEPRIYIQQLSTDAYVCNLTSVTPGEQPSGSGQL